MDAAAMAEMIRKLKQQFEENRQLIIEKSRLISQSQQGAGLSLEHQMLLLQTLVARAKLAKTAVNPMSREDLENERARMGRNMDKVQGALEQSLLQVSDDADHLSVARRQMLVANDVGLANRTLNEEDDNLDVEFRSWKRRLNANRSRRLDANRSNASSRQETKQTKQTRSSHLRLDGVP